jgi:hypothetical protein
LVASTVSVPPQVSLAFQDFVREKIDEAKTTWKTTDFVGFLVDCISFPALFLGSCDWEGLPPEKVDELSLAVNAHPQRADWRDVVLEQAADRWRVFTHFCVLLPKLITELAGRRPDFPYVLGRLCAVLPITHRYVVSSFLRMMVNILLRIDNESNNSTLVQFLGLIFRDFPQLFETMAQQPLSGAWHNIVRRTEWEYSRNFFQMPVSRAPWDDLVTPSRACRALKEAFALEGIKELTDGLGAPIGGDGAVLEFKPSYKEFRELYLCPNAIVP